MAGNSLISKIAAGVASAGIVGMVVVYGTQMAMGEKIGKLETAAQAAGETRDRVIVIEKDIEHIRIDQKAFQERADEAHDQILDEIRKVTRP